MNLIAIRQVATSDPIGKRAAVPDQVADRSAAPPFVATRGGFCLSIRVCPTRLYRVESSSGNNYSGIPGFTVNYVLARVS